MKATKIFVVDRDKSHSMWILNCFVKRFPELVSRKNKDEVILKTGTIIKAVALYDKYQLGNTKYEEIPADEFMEYIYSILYETYKKRIKDAKLLITGIKLLNEVNSTDHPITEKTLEDIYDVLSGAYGIEGEELECDIN